MTQFATITGHVTYTPGDGAPITIPRGRVEVDLNADSATLSWQAAEDVAGRPPFRASSTTNTCRTARSHPTCSNRQRFRPVQQSLLIP